MIEANKVGAVISGHTHIGRSGFATQPPGSELPPIPTRVIPTDYGTPAYVVLDSTTQGIAER